MGSCLTPDSPHVPHCIPVLKFVEIHMQLQSNRRLSTLRCLRTEKPKRVAASETAWWGHQKAKEDDYITINSNNNTNLIYKAPCGRRTRTCNFRMTLRVMAREWDCDEKTTGGSRHLFIYASHIAVSMWRRSSRNNKITVSLWCFYTPR